MEIVRPDFLPITLILIWRYRARRSLRLPFGVRALRLCGICFIKTKHPVSTDGLRLHCRQSEGLEKNVNDIAAIRVAYTRNTENWLQQPLSLVQARRSLISVSGKLDRDRRVITPVSYSC